MNEADSRRLASSLEGLGGLPTDRPELADVVVLNTCVVRQSAEDKVLGRLGSLKAVKRRHPQTIIGVMGCFVGRTDPAPLRDRYPWVDVFMPPSEPSPLIDYLVDRDMADEARASEALCAARRLSLLDDVFLLPRAERNNLVSAYIPVVLGCSHACTYCVIPYRRGPERSRPIAEVFAEATSLAAQGVKEITLLGQIVDRYGLDLDSSDGRPNMPLAALLRRLDTINGLHRIRFLTSHPSWMRDELLDAVAELPRACEHIEIPIQAGDDVVLERMGRGYTVEQYRKLVGHIRDLIPTASIATDVIVGFPGETEAQFTHTYDLLSDLRFDKVHIARYSPRPSTLASRRFADDVPYEEKERRRKALDDLQASIVAQINGRLKGEIVEVLVEGKRRGRWRGRTRTDKLVFFDSEAEWNGKLALVRITWTGPWSLIGEVTE
jgi:tRNA-2-methylthio-N6-dimethylallyladenosine synthase